MAHRASKHPEITSALRRKIIDGEIRPGDRLPNRVALERQFGVSTVTIQKALDRLSSDGFVSSHRRRGTFVASHPPHLTRFAVAFYSNPSEFYWGKFWEALRNIAGEIERSSEREMPCFFDMQGHPDGEDHQKLVRDIRAQRLAGIIFTFPPDVLRDSPILNDPSVPRVGIIGANNMFDFPIVSHDRDSFYTKALDYLQQRGRRAIACLFKSNSLQAPLRNEFVRDLAARGFTPRPHWRQVADAYDPESAMSAIHAVFHPGQSERPDALLLDDDNLLDGAVAGLVAAGVRVPHDVEVVALCNFPAPPRPVLQVTRLGFDAREAMRKSIELIDLQRQGRKTPRLVQLPARFDNELVNEPSP